jgi:hypothetical protein
MYSAAAYLLRCTGHTDDLRPVGRTHWPRDESLGNPEERPGRPQPKPLEYHTQHLLIYLRVWPNQKIRPLGADVLNDHSKSVIEPTGPVRLSQRLLGLSNQSQVARSSILGTARHRRPRRDDRRDRRRVGAIAGGSQLDRTSVGCAVGFNHRRLLEPIGHVPPAEYERDYHRLNEAQAMAA